MLNEIDYNNLIINILYLKKLKKLIFYDFLKIKNLKTSLQNLF
jgi:hypothetical protein